MQRFLTACFVLLIVSSAGAQSTTDRLGEGSLLGTWRLISTSDSPDVKGPPLEGVELRWTFEADGTGTYFQKLSEDDVTGTSDVSWTLEGDTLVFDGTTKCTVESFAGDSMVWRLQPYTDYYYHIERQ